MRAIVSGSGGFLGGHLLRELAGRGATVGTFGIRGPARPGHLILDGCSDVAGLAAWLRASPPDAVFHMAGATGGIPVEEMYRVNVVLGVTLIEALEVAGLGHVPILMMGSAAEIGPVGLEDPPIAEERPCRPVTAYGISKHAQTLHGLAAARGGRPVVVARLFNVAGPGMGGYTALAEFARQIAACRCDGVGVVRSGDLDSIRDYLSAEDVARLVVELVSAPAAWGRVVNLCSGRGQRIRDLLERMIELSGLSLEIETDSGRLRPLDVPSVVGDPSLLASIVGRVPAPMGDATLRGLLAGETPLRHS
ncbi:NAD-dependent epimerase/dehydratase family protein [Arenibaculum sp.]|jgi:GDP-4-dehydro-6-deoxy-D-mannose reductase|uniref:NAD-dependent epimerase/dehydratase family protein n=1 Tax=Arenibaculum sp. TaxID=2865862 RepID=UPI002E14CDE2|nr:NAD-dependent epimerase/dehydratase family protein [Arenibaculum sp.]